MLQVLWGLGGMVVLLAIAWLLSVDRRRIRYRTVLLALLVQVTFGVLVLYVPAGQRVLETVTSGVQSVINSSAEGIAFLFGPILPDEGSVFAFQVLPVIVFFAALTAVLYHVGLLQLVTRWIGGALAKLLGTTGPESMNAAANIFVGQTEAPLVIRPYIKDMTPSEIFAVMAGGLTTVAGSVLVGYSLLGANLEYLIAASFMAAPAGLLMAKMLVPAGALADIGPNAETAPTPDAPVADTDDDGDTSGRGGSRLAAAFRRGSRRGGTHEGRDELVRRARGEDAPEEDEEEPPVNVIDAAARGASDGLTLALNVGAMLLAFISLIALANIVVGGIGGWFGNDDLSVEEILGYVFSPVMAAVGVPLHEAVDAGSFLGQKVILNEFVAFSDFAPNAEDFSEKSQAVITFALTGFANLGSLAILLGGLGGIAPTQRGVIATLGLRAVLAGTLGNLLSAAIAGILIG
ncbi:concentrative nucleoside transporter, CNT family [Georgenia satyanarayanai]|uniref:Concentrative nucleoside transporter, CNT family n=1 Tax=Georgenia satyanarayanai TaxID=860221 RepID=A0A2Y9AB99_9MICO|nr:nucleoside transporter C-terminal domain-containing protein [Georgenia satyanarayanai]PYF99887.1 CNT family concentrative nucleoside transporter [Georgenia satyanarayanai]SSA41881.1 concentrative nucleoside transporter, CNT family [Georgenia satyanarayanai]